MRKLHFTLHKKLLLQEDWHKLVFCLCFRFKQHKQHIISNLSATPHQHCHQQAFNQRTTQLCTTLIMKKGGLLGVEVVGLQWWRGRKAGMVFAHVIITVSK